MILFMSFVYPYIYGSVVQVSNVHRNLYLFTFIFCHVTNFKLSLSCYMTYKIFTFFAYAFTFVLFYIFMQLKTINSGGNTL